MSISKAACHSVGLPDGEVFALAEPECILCIWSQGLAAMDTFWLQQGGLAGARPVPALINQEGRRKVRQHQNGRSPVEAAR